MAGNRLIKVSVILATLVSCAGEPGSSAPADEARAQEPAARRGAGARAQQPPPGDCVDGWTEPPAGTELFQRPLDVIASTMGLEPSFDVAEMRYFTGPEAPPVDKGYLQDIERWYVKAEHADGLRGRWLVERRRFGAGVVAVASWRSEGFRSPDWVGFQLNTADRTRRRYPGLPGRWEGIPYDFVVGSAGLDNPGLPPAITGCLTGT